MSDFSWLITAIFFFHFADSQLTRKVPASYADGVYKMPGEFRPSPRSISQALMKGSDGLPSRRNRTALHTFFGKNFNFVIYWEKRGQYLSEVLIFRQSMLCCGCHKSTRRQPYVLEILMKVSKGMLSRRKHTAMHDFFCTN